MFYQTKTNNYSFKFFLCFFTFKHLFVMLFLALIIGSENFSYRFPLIQTVFMGAVLVSKFVEKAFFLRFVQGLKLEHRIR